MIKEQIKEIERQVFWAARAGKTSQQINLEEFTDKVTAQILNLLKEELDKLTVMGDEEIDKLWDKYEKEDPYQATSWDYVLANAQLNHTKREIKILGG